MKNLLIVPATQGAARPLKIQPRQGQRVRSCSLSDRIGIFASILCAVHCLATPFILLFAPVFGGIWAHPASHWGVALFVVPLAGFTMVKGYRMHRRKWVIACGFSGILLIVSGALLPYFETLSSPVIALPESDDVEFIYEVKDDVAIVECQDSCCPSIIQNAEGASVLHIPIASVVTTLGGIALILTHLGNLCRCGRCRETP